MLSLLLLSLLAAEPLPARAISDSTNPASKVPTVAVVCPRELRDALKPWIEYREQQGYSLAMLEPAAPEKMQQAIRQLACSGKLTHVVLVGDADMAASSTKPTVVVPTFKVKSQVSVQFGSEPEIAADNPLADLDGDGLPDVSIGRISVDRPDQLGSVVRKIIAYETNPNFGAWRGRVNLVAGVGGFGALVDGTIEMTAKKFLCDGVPAAYSTTMTYGSWRSPYCPDPAQFQNEVVKHFNQGSLFWVYIGHGHPERLDRIHVPGAAYPILEPRDVVKLDCENGSPIALLLACYTGAFDFPRECLAEEMLRLPGGPVAVLAGSRVTMPYAMAVLSDAMIDECFQNQPATLGEIVLHAKRRSVASAPADVEATIESTGKIDNRQLLDALGKLLSPKPDLIEAERREHLALFNLLGDPLLRIAYPETVQLTSAEEVSAGEKLPITIKAPLAGKCTLQVVCRRDCLTFDPPTRSEFTTQPAALQEVQRVYEQANDHRFAEHIIDISAGTFEADVPIPANAHGACHVRAFIAGEGKYAVGASNVYVRRATAVPAK